MRPVLSKNEQSALQEVKEGPVVMSPEEVESRLTRATPFYQTVEREGVLL